MEIDFFENENDFQRIRCGEVFFENKDQKLLYQCLFCNILFEQNKFTQFNQHLFEHLDFDEKELPEKEFSNEAEFLDIDLVKSDDDDSNLVHQNDTTEFLSKTVMSNIKSFSENDATVNDYDGDKQVRKFQCPYCDANYRRRSPLYSHLEKKHDIVTSFEVEPDVFGKYPCPECDTECCNKGSFILHVRRKHEEYFYGTLEKQQIKKDLKLKKFAQNDSEILISEETTREPQNPIITFKEVEFVESDITLFLDAESNPISTTLKRPFDDGNDIYNLGSKKKMKHDCPCCQYTNTTRYGICKHLEKQHGISAILQVEANPNGKFECSQCLTIFDYKGNLAYHLKQKHEQHYFELLEKQQEKFKIKSGSISTKWFENKSEKNDFVDLTLGEFGARRIMHKVKQVHRCSYCSYWTGRRNNLYRHLESKHNIAALLDVEPNSNGKYECPHCSIVITVKGNFIHHLKRKHREFFCERIALQQKKRDGIDPETEEADYDNIIKIEEPANKKKLLTRENENKIVDPVAETLIKYSNVEKKETLVDTIDTTSVFESKKFKCTYCDAAYHQLTALYCHLEKNHGIARELEIAANADGFECSQCKMTAPNKDALISHLKLKHKSYAKKFVKELENYKLKSEEPNKMDQITDLSPLKISFEIDNLTLENLNSSPTSEAVQTKNEVDSNYFSRSLFHNCPNCEYKSKFRSLIFRHLESKHGIINSLSVNKHPDGKYHCLKCTTAIFNKKNFIDHLKVEHESYYYQLLVKQEIENEKNSTKTNDISSKISESDSSEEEEESEDYDVDVLDVISSLKPLQKIKNLYNCPQENCEYTSKSLKVMQHHNRDQHSDLYSKTWKYQCPHCDRAYTTHGGIGKHLDLVHGIANKVVLEPESDGKFHCKKCDFIAQRKLSITKHLVRNHRKYYYELLSQQQLVYESSQKTNNVCEICQKELPSYSSLKKHLAYHKRPPIDCSICGKTLNNKSTFNAHMKIHLDIRNYSCRFCNLTFVKKEVKDKHEIRIHLKRKDYTCDTCGQQYFTRHLLNNHLRRHTNEKPAECNICHKRFYDSNGLRNHKLIHLEVKKYECNICGKRFRRGYLLKTHRELHEGLKKYKCVICDMDFAQNAGLYSHMRNKHKDVRGKSVESDKSLDY